MSGHAITFKITTPHAKDCPSYGWFFPNGWSGMFPDWFVLSCNAQGCPGRAAVPVSFVTDHADDSDPSVEPRRWRDA